MGDTYFDETHHNTAILAEINVSTNENDYQ
jgi:hypothetical protein